MRDLRGPDRFRAVSSWIYSLEDSFGKWKRITPGVDVWSNPNGELNVFLGNYLIGDDKEFVSGLDELLGKYILILENDPMREIYCAHVMRADSISIEANNYDIGFKSGVTMFSFFRDYSESSFMEDFKNYPNQGNNKDGSSIFSLRRNNLIELLEIDDCWEDVLRIFSRYESPFGFKFNFKSYNVDTDGKILKEDRR